MGTNTFEHAEFKSENFPHRRPAVFSQTAILSSLISQQISQQAYADISPLRRKFTEQILYLGTGLCL
jgi:hypothetical protein